MKTKATSPIAEANRFFFEHAGYCVPPGRLQCARKLAKAERDARSKGFTFEWEHDQCGCSGCDCGDETCPCFAKTEHETLCCVCKDESGEVVASLSGICEPSREYRRVVEAELAQEGKATA